MDMVEIDKMRHDARLYGQGVLLNGKHVPLGDFYASPIEYAVSKMGATPADMPGLWCVPGHPELTTNQLLDIANRT